MLRMLLVGGLALLGLGAAIRSGFGALLFYLWVAYFRPSEWVWNAEILAVLNLSFVAGLLAVLRAPGSGARFRFDFRVLLLLLMLLHSMLSTALSPYPSYSWPYWIEFLKAITITYLLACHTIDMDRLRKVVFVIALSLGFEGAKQGWVQLLTNPGARNMNEFALLGDNNGVAVGMLMLAPLFVALAQTSATTTERWFHRFFAVGIAYRAIATYSRGGFLAAAVMSCVYVMRSKHKFRSTIGLLAIAAIVASALPSEFWDRMSTIRVEQTKEDAENTSATSRLHFWNVAVDMAADRPLIGIGFNGFNRSYDDYDSLHGYYGKGRSVHSSWFGVLAELGYPGLIMYVTVLLLAIAACQQTARLAKSGKAPPELYFFAVAIQTGFAACVVGSSFVPWQYCEMLWHFVGLSMGLRTLVALQTESVSVPEATPTEVPAKRMFRPVPESWSA